MRFYLHEMSGIGRFTATECRLPVARGWQKGGMGMTAHGYGVASGGDEDVLALCDADGRTAV